MGFKGNIQKAVKGAFAATGDLPVKATYHHRAAAGTGNLAEYDTESGTITENIVSYPLPEVIFVRFKAGTTDKDVVIETDMKMIYPKQDLPIEPQASDSVVDAKLRQWEIVRLMGEPADAVTILLVRTAGPGA